MTTANQKISYKDSGVDIEAGDALVEKIKARVKSTYNDRVVSGVGGFAALYKMGDGKLLAAGTDGVGTKVKIAQALDMHDTIGIDLVAMCVNDVICTGAKPLFFLDYLATGKLDIRVADEIIKGIVEGCKQSEMALIGGETAEMPGVYQPHEYDLAGFAIGEVDENKVLDGRTIKEGDTLFALPSSGIHSNGFSLVRKLIKPEEKDLLKTALTPTRIYWSVVKEILPLVNGMAHITGGGLANIPRMNGGFDYVLDHLPAPLPIFAELGKRSGLDAKTMYETFNMGIGLVVATDRPEELALRLSQMKEEFFKIGHIAKGQGQAVVHSGGMDFCL